MIGFVVEKVGVQALVEDAGRFGLRHVGVPTGGPADAVAHAQANALLGQGPAAALEVLLGGIELRITRPLVVAVAGAECDVLVDGAPAPFRRPVALTSGQVLTLGPARGGVRTYLAVSGGIAVDEVLGSASCDPRNDLGPSPLMVGDVVEVGEPWAPVAHDYEVAPRVAGPELVVAATWGPRADWFTPQAREQFAASLWEVTSEADRIGMRLSGPVLAREVERELRSEGVVPGSVQVPPNGQPIVFGPDSPTTGGYPVIAVVDAEGLAALGQAGPGCRVRFDVADQPGPWG